MSEFTLSQPCRFLPLAITRVDETYGCIGAVTEDGSWVRPEPIYLEELESPDSIYRYFYWTAAYLKASTAVDLRPEDRDLSQTDDEPQLLFALPDTQRLHFLLKHTDANVEAAFGAQRSLGLIETCVKRFYVKRSTGGKSFVRGEFIDATGEVFDWIIPEIAFGRIVWPYVAEGVLTPSFSERLSDTFAHVRTFFTVGLTKPNFRFPGKFRNCHPLIVGIHSEPNYVPLLENIQGPV
jgi:hypothetical protein